MPRRKALVFPQISFAVIIEEAMKVESRYWCLQPEETAFLAVVMLVNMYAGQKPVCWWNIMFENLYAIVYWKNFHQQTFKFLFSSTFRKFFTNIFFSTTSLQPPF